VTHDIKCDEWGEGGEKHGLCAQYQPLATAAEFGNVILKRVSGTQVQVLN
jgi:hypothetical protein